jgi:hypothetical protein
VLEIIVQSARIGNANSEAAAPSVFVSPLPFYRNSSKERRKYHGMDAPRSPICFSCRAAIRTGIRLKMNGPRSAGMLQSSIYPLHHAFE